jgi:hypothetical protein
MDGMDCPELMERLRQVGVEVKLLNPSELDEEIYCRKERCAIQSEAADLCVPVRLECPETGLFR